MARQSVEHSHIPARRVKPLTGFNVADFGDLADIGIDLSDDVVHAMAAALSEGVGMDALNPLLTIPSIVTPIQFLQNWLPGFVAMLTNARKIDQLVGISTVGNWEDEEIVQGVMELTGGAVPYSDFGNVPLANWNINFTERTIVRFEQGIRVATLEEARTAKMKVNTADMKRKAATEGLEIQRNAIGFFGYNTGANWTYGFLNDPGIVAAVVTVPATGTGSQTFWSTKSFLQIVADLRTAFSALRTQSGEVIDPGVTPITIAISTAVVDYLTVTSDFGISVQDWLNKAYPNVRVVSAPELNGAVSGLNGMIVYAENVNDALSTDDGRTWVQVVPTKFKVLGVQNMIKGYEEDYTNATAGVFCKRPFAVVRYNGL